MFESSEIIYQNKDWMALVFLIIFFVLTTLKILFNERLFNTGTLFFSKKYLSIYFNKEKSNVLNLFQALFFLIQVLILSLLFYFIEAHYELFREYSNFEAYVFIFIIIADYFCFRFLIGLFLSYILDLKPIYNKILYQKISYFNNVVLWILPFLIATAYTPILRDFFYNITIILFIFLLIFRYSLMIYNNKNLIFNNLFYFILYLCALEITPLVIILKLTI
ncbi:DUF4271 domain-containing protein [Lutibacter sp. B1]|uniref:DUF4271 domain-containing protein n=1 Tax=Lutibacter sp. B1 TaxID=2725996 RepID=UPI0014563DA8|nr:DUF4271 domain-containing protein [Lutibacter sp. B1]NLP57246.1 DUF4271 domain-containing protein [Lutibacter sp. B1]